MNKRRVLGAFLATALALVPGTSYARWMDPNSGRFQTVDAYEGDQAEPQSLHRYTYASDDPVNEIDPSGYDGDLPTLSVVEISEADMDAAANVINGVVRRQAIKNLASSVAKATVASAVLLTLEGDDDPDAFVVRGGVATPQQLKVGTAPHLSVPGLTGFSVQSARSKTIPELAKAGRFPNRQISVTTMQSINATGKLLGYNVRVVKSPGVGYHCTVTTPLPLPAPLAIALSAAFTQMPNPFPWP